MKIGRCLTLLVHFRSSFDQRTMVIFPRRTSTRFSAGKVFFAIKRYLYTEESLGLIGFSHWCDERRKNCCLSTDDASARIDKILSNPDQFILTDDFKNALAYGDSFKNFDFLPKLCKFYNDQIRKTKISYFNFGPFVMRFYHKMRQPDLAFSSITDKDLTEFFDDLNSYQICMDLLYESKKFERLLDLWQHFQNHSKIAEKMKFPRSLIVLVYGALYNQNTKEAKDYALKLYSAFRGETGKNIPRKALMFFVCLCKKLENYEIAYELLSTTNCDDFLIGRTTKIILSAKLNRLPEIYRLFQKTIESDLPTSSFEDNEISYDILQPVEQAFSSKDPGAKERLERYLKLLRMGRHIVNVSLDDLLTTPVILAPSSKDAVQELSTNEERLNFIPPANPGASLTYKDEAEALEDLEKFQKAERKQKRKEKIIQAVAKKIMRDGPFEA